MAVSQSLLNQVQELYIAFFDRPADFGGLIYWAGDLAQNGDNVQVISDSFATSPEAQNLYPSSMSVNTVISDMFQNLFGRNVDPTGLQFWANAYNTYHMSYGQLAYDILQAGISANNSLDYQTIYNKVQAANVFTDTYQNSPYPNISIANQFVSKVTAYQSLISLTPQEVQNFVNGFGNQTFQLTPGVDTLTGTNAVGNTFDGAPNTWTAGDSITGAQGANNILNLTDTSTTALTSAWNLNPANTSVSGVQTVNVTEPNGPVTINTTNWSGVTNLNITDSDGTIGNTTITAAPTTTISLTDNDLGSGTDKITGGQNVSVTEYKVVGTASAPASIIDGNSAAATPTLGSITTVSLDAAGAAGVVTITDNNLQNLTVNNFEGTGSATSPTNVTINDNSGVSNVPTTLTLNVNNDILGGTLTPTPTTITESDQNPAGKGQYTTLNVVTQGAQSSNIALSAFNALTTLNVSGNSAQSTLMLGGLPTSLTSITDSSSGVVNVVMPNSTSTTTTANFNGSAAAGQEIVTITQPLASTASIQGGTATNNELVIVPSVNFTTDTLVNGATAISSFGTGTISGFEVLGINDSTGGYSFDIAALGAQLGSGFNNTVDLQQVATVKTDTLYNLANNSTLQFDHGVAGEIDSTAAVNSMNIVLNGVGAGGSTPAGPTINLSSVTGAGATTLNIQDTANSVSNYINTLQDNTLTTLNITANHNLTFITGITDSPSTALPSVAINLNGAGLLSLGTDIFNAKVLTITDNSTNQGATTITSLVDNTNGNALTTLNLAGSHSLTIGSLGINGTPLAALTNINFSGSGTDTITNLYDNAATLTIANTGTGTASIDTASGSNVSSNNPNLTTLTLSGNVGLGTYNSGTWTGGLSATTTAGFTLAGATDNANINFSLTDKTTTSSLSGPLPSNTIVLGNGSDQIALTSNLASITTAYTGSGAALTNNITVGTGTNSIILQDSNGNGANVSDIIKFADNSAVFTGGTTPTHLTTVTLDVPSPGVSTPPTNVSFDLSSVLGSNALHFDSTAISETAATLSAALSAAVATVHGVNDNAGYFTYTPTGGTATTTYLFADSATNSGHEAIIALVGTSYTMSQTAQTDHVAVAVAVA